jgi:hypothetical protein
MYFIPVLLLINLPIFLPIGRAMCGSPFLSGVNADQPEIRTEKTNRLEWIF